MRRTPLLIAAIVIALMVGLVAAGCGGDDDDGAEATTTEATTEATTAADTTTAPATTSADTSGAAAEGDAQAGLVVFEETGCGSCHTLSAAGSTGAIGPNLDEALQGADAAFIRESIVDPNAVVAEGFAANIMPQDYADQLSEQQITDLVALLQQ